MGLPNWIAPKGFNYFDLGSRMNYEQKVPLQGLIKSIAFLCRAIVTVHPLPAWQLLSHIVQTAYNKVSFTAIIIKYYYTHTNFSAIGINFNNSWSKTRNIWKHFLVPTINNNDDWASVMRECNKNDFDFRLDWLIRFSTIFIKRNIS